MKNQQIFISNNWLKKNKKNIIKFEKKINSNFFFKDFNFNLFQDNIFINNYFYFFSLYKVSTKDHFYEILFFYYATNYYFLLKYYNYKSNSLLENMEKIKEQYNLKFNLKFNYENKLKIFSYKNYDNFHIHNLSKIIGNLYASTFSPFSNLNKKLYYDYGYYLVLLWHLNFLKNELSLDQLKIYQSKLFVSYETCEIIKKIVPFIFNYFIIENNRMIIKMKGKYETKRL